MPSYPFLSQPPPSTRKRSSTFTAIANWAAHVQPGSPSPQKASFLVIETPSADHKEFTIDLTNLGYTPVFLPTNTPLSANSNSTLTGAMKRIRSLSILRPRNRSAMPTNLPPSPTKPHSAAIIDRETSPQIVAASAVKRKKAVYTHIKPTNDPAATTTKSNSKSKSTSKPNLPPHLAAELALMQFADGGSTEENIKRLMEAHARSSAPAGTRDKDIVIDDVYRDGKGGVWWDREEEIEYVHLLAGRGTSDVKGQQDKWVSFGGEVVVGHSHEEEEGEATLAIVGLADDGRRHSKHSIMSANSLLDPTNIVKVAEEDSSLVSVPFAPVSHSPSQLKTKRRSSPTSEPILTIPSRPRRGPQHHLRAKSNFFLLDLDAFSVPCTPRSPHTPARTPTSPPHSYAQYHPTTRSCSSPTGPFFPQQLHQQKRKRGASRRRPAPLSIVAHLPMRGVSPDFGGDDDEYVQAEEARKEFLDAAWVPPKVQAEPKMRIWGREKETSQSQSGVLEARSGVAKTLKKKGSRAILGFFGRK